MYFNIGFSASFESVVIGNTPEIIIFSGEIRFVIKIRLRTTSSRMLPFLLDFPLVLCFIDYSQAACTMIRNKEDTFDAIMKILFNILQNPIEDIHFLNYMYRKFCLLVVVIAISFMLKIVQILYIYMISEVTNELLVHTGNGWQFAICQIYIKRHILGIAEFSYIVKEFYTKCIYKV